MTKFIEKSYMVASIMKINRKYLRESYVTKRQLNILTWHMQKIFNERNIDAIFVDDIDYSYFEDCGDVIMLHDNYKHNFEGIEQRFQAYLPMEILSIIWDEEFMVSIVIDNNEDIHKEIDMDDYNKVKARIDSMMSENELVEVHKNLVGKSCKNDFYEINDCGVDFIRECLSRDRGRSIVYQYSKGLEKFIYSKYLSDYFKSSIKELLIDEDLSDKVVSLLDSDKLINDMSEEELSVIYSAIKVFYNKPIKAKKANVANHFMSLLYKLNGKGVVSFIKNNVDNNDLARHILLTSGLNDRASYYSGRGVNYSDLNEKNLVAIFGKLLRLDNCYAVEFVEMVRQMKTLGATEFINSFMDFATNDFKVDNLKTEDSNISLDGVYGDARDTVAYISMISTMSRGNDMEYQVSVSEQMKHSFISKIKPVLVEINPKFDDEYNQGFDDNYDQEFNTYRYWKRR